MILENLKQAYLFKANYYLERNTNICLYQLTMEFSEMINSTEFSKFSVIERQLSIDEFKAQLDTKNKTLEYKKVS